MKLNIPNKLCKGDTIGVVAPSAGNAKIFPHRIKTAERMLNKMGYEIKTAKHSLQNIDYVSSNAKNRAQDINDMFSDKKVKAIICTIGGDHSNQILKYLDFEVIKNNPKIFIGFSDISVLHYAFASKANLQTFYGPCLMTQFGEYPEILPYTLKYFLKAVTETSKIGEINPSINWTTEILDWFKKNDLKRPRKLLKSNGYEWIREGTAKGNVFGGCIPSINHLLGTDYWVEPNNKIFFIDIPEGHEFGEGLPLHSLDSYLADLDNVGLFNKISGLLIGRPYNYSKDDVLKLKKIISYYTANSSYPILYNVNIGHADPIITLPLNVEVILDSTKNLFYINSNGVN